MIINAVSSHPQVAILCPEPALPIHTPTQAAQGPREVHRCSASTSCQCLQLSGESLKCQYPSGHEKKNKHESELWEIVKVSVCCERGAQGSLPVQAALCAAVT